MEILHLKKTMNQMNNAIKNINRIDQAEERINDIEDRNFVVMQLEEIKEKIMKKKPM